MPGLMPLPLDPFARSAAVAVGAALGVDPALFAVTVPPQPELGDFAVGVFPAARQLREPAPALAARIASQFTPGEHLAGAQASGPFVNFRANREAVFRHLLQATLPAGGTAPAGLIPGTVGAGKTVCIDYSSPNISKHLAYHHIRSTVIGQALANLYRAVGYRVVGINHLGDWGTTHGMTLAAYERWGAEEPLTVSALNELYTRFRAAIKEEPALEEEGRLWFKRLEEGDPEARQLWQRFRDVSLAELQTVYDALGVRFDEVRGESAYEADMPAVLAMLAAKGLSEMSEDALVVPLEGMPPLLLRKQDGATLYATRDLAAALYRWNQYHFHRSLYVVDRGQGLHFKQLFATLARAGYPWAAQCEHVSFGLVRIGGKKTGTRSGNVVLLKNVLAEAEERSAARIREANPDMAPDELERTARMVGIGAVVFANLVSQREKDVDFDWEDVLTVKGDSGPYVQYAHARCASILRRAGALQPRPDAPVAALTHPAEWALARKLCDLPDVVLRATESNEPHVVSRYLLELTAVFSQWYTLGSGDPALRVIGPDESLSTARLSLVAATQQVLAQGLGLLGLQGPEQM
jgi:arginyl-tRNA synthetase